MKEILKKYLENYTNLSEEKMQAILDKIPVKTFTKGKVLLEQGDIPNACYFILKGCIRQYKIDENGRDITVNFYMEEDSVSIYNNHVEEQFSKYGLECLEDCVLVVGDLKIEPQMYEDHPELLMMTQMMVQEKLEDTHEIFSSLLTSSPEERVMYIMRKRPALFERVAQHQLASYLGMTPESLSRIKGRLERRHLKIVD